MALRKGVLKSLLLFREIPIWRVIQHKTWRVFHSEFCPLWTSIVFPPPLFSLKLIFGSLSGPSCVGRVTKAMYVSFHCCRKLLFCLSAFDSFLQPQKCCAKRAKGGCALALPATRQMILTSTWIERNWCCQFSNRIVVAKGIIATWDEVNIPCLFLWLLSLFNSCFLHVMPSTVFLNWCFIHRKEKHVVCKKTWQLHLKSDTWLLHHFLVRTENQSQYPEMWFHFFFLNFAF